MIVAVDTTRPESAVILPRITSGTFCARTEVPASKSSNAAAGVRWEPMRGGMGNSCHWAIGRSTPQQPPEFLRARCRPGTLRAHLQLVSVPEGHTSASLERPAQARVYTPASRLCCPDARLPPDRHRSSPSHPHFPPSPPHLY